MYAGAERSRADSAHSMHAISDFGYRRNDPSWKDSIKLHPTCAMREKNALPDVRSGRLLTPLVPVG